MYLQAVFQALRSVKVLAAGTQGACHMLSVVASYLNFKMAVHKETLSHTYTVQNAFPKCLYSMPTKALAKWECRWFSGMLCSQIWTVLYGRKEPAVSPEK